MSIARAVAVPALLLAAGCGGSDEPKSDEEKIGEVARQYVHSASNNEREKCRETLASGVDPRLCGDLEPLVARNDPEVKKEAKITGSTAKVTVSGAGPTLLEIEVVEQGGDWKVKSWKGYAPGQKPHGGPTDPSSGGAAPPETTTPDTGGDSGSGY
jgi:hypothetical protein